MIVFGIANAHGVVDGELQAFERTLEAGGFVHPGRQDHHGPLVEDHLKLETEIANHIQHDGLVGLPGRHDHVADGQRGDISCAERVDEGCRRRFAQDLELTISRRINDRPVLADHTVEQIETLEDSEDVFDFAAGHQDEPASGLLHGLQGRDGLVVHDTVGGERAVVIDGEHGVPHACFLVIAHVCDWHMNVGTSINEARAMPSNRSSFRSARLCSERTDAPMSVPR